MRAVYCLNMKAATSAVCCLLAAVISVFSARPAHIAAAGESSRLARADSRSVYFCDEMDDGAARFAIPYTYCVRVLETVDGWYRVKYAEDVGEYRALYGYCRKTGLTEIAEPPENVFLNMTVSVKFSQEPIDPSLPAFSGVTVEAAYYGAYYLDGAAYSYVLYGGEFAYVVGANDGYPLNEIPQKPAPSSGKGADVKLILVISLIAVAAAALLILYFTGKTAKFKQR